MRYAVYAIINNFIYELGRFYYIEDANFFATCYENTYYYETFVEEI